MPIANRHPINKIFNALTFSEACDIVMEAAKFEIVYQRSATGRCEEELHLIDLSSDAKQARAIYNARLGEAVLIAQTQAAKEMRECNLVAFADALEADDFSKLAF